MERIWLRLLGLLSKNTQQDNLIVKHFLKVFVFGRSHKLREVNRLSGGKIKKGNKAKVVYMQRNA